MGVLKKGRRKIAVNGKNYVWYIKEDEETPFHMLNIISEDKKLIISYPLETDISYIINKGMLFQGKRTDGYWNRYLLPFRMPEIITPKIVSKVILWAAHGEQAVRADLDFHNYYP